MNDVIFINNSRCSTCQKTMKILEEKKANVQIINYLDGELTKELLLKAVKAVGVPARELLREKEPEYQALTINLNDDAEVIDAILKQPKLLQRPIVLKGDKGVIARPPENILDLFVS